MVGTAPFFFFNTLLTLICRNGKMTQICSLVWMDCHLNNTAIRHLNKHSLHGQVGKKKENCNILTDKSDKYLTVNFYIIRQDTVKFVNFIFNSALYNHGTFRRTCTLYSQPPLHLLQVCFQFY